MKVVQSPQLGMNRCVATGFRTDRPRASRIARPGHQTIIRALPKLSSNWMDRRQIKHIKTHIRNFRQPSNHILKITMPAILKCR